MRFSQREAAFLLREPDCTRVAMLWAVWFVIFQAFAAIPSVAANNPAISIKPSSTWHGTSEGNWSTFEVLVGSPGQVLQLAVSTTSAGLRVPGACDGDNDATTVTVFAPGNSSSWKGVQDSNHFAFQGFDMIHFSTTNPNTTVSRDQVKINITKNPTSDYTGWIGLGNHDGNYNEKPVWSLIAQLSRSKSIPSASYGYTAGASYGSGTGIPASLVLGGYDSARFRYNQTATFTLSQKTSGPVPAVNVTAIELTPTKGNSTSILTQYEQPFMAIVDPGTPYLWFPETICDRFSELFHLTWNETLQHYLFPDHTAANQFRDVQTYSFLFSFSNHSATKSLNPAAISISPSAFSLTMRVRNSSQDLPGYHELPYFPLKPGRSENGHYTIGRAFLQEAYLFTDYGRGRFFLGEAVFPENPETNFTIVDVSPPSSGISRADILALIFVSACLFIPVTGLFIYHFVRRWKELDDMTLPQHVMTAGIGKFPHEADETNEPGEFESPEESSIFTKSTSESDSSSLEPTVELYKQRAVDTLMTEFKSLLSHGPLIGISIRAGGRQSWEDCSKPSSNPSTTESKHRRVGPVNGENYKDGGKVEAIRRVRVDASQGPKFACPFYKRNPKKHLRHRSCAGPGWAEVRRVKEHIYRVHSLPIHCQRCGVLMNTNMDLRAHQRQPEECQIRHVDWPEGFDKGQEKELRKRKQGETEEQRWYGMYNILFPDEDGDLVPSPYYKKDDISGAEKQRMDELKQYERFQRREMLRLVRRMLQETVSGMAGPLEDQLRTQFVSIIRQAQSEVFQAYRSNDPKNKITHSRASNHVSTNLEVLGESAEQLRSHALDKPSDMPYPQTTGSSATLDVTQHPQSRGTFDHNPISDVLGYSNLLLLDEASLSSVFDSVANPPASLLTFAHHGQTPDQDEMMAGSNDMLCITRYPDTSNSVPPPSHDTGTSSCDPSSSNDSTGEFPVHDASPTGPSQGPSVPMHTALPPLSDGGGRETAEQGYWDDIFYWNKELHFN